jgi:hypothetical protein
MTVKVPPNRSPHLKAMQSRGESSMEVDFDPEQSFTDGSEWAFFVCSLGFKQTSFPATLASIWRSVIAWVADRTADTPVEAL